MKTLLLNLLSAGVTLAAVTFLNAAQAASYPAILEVEGQGHLRTEPIEPGCRYVMLGTGFTPNEPIRIVDTVTYQYPAGALVGWFDPGLVPPEAPPKPVSGEPTGEYAEVEYFTDATQDDGDIAYEFISWSEGDHIYYGYQGNTFHKLQAVGRGDVHSHHGFPCQEQYWYSPPDNPYRGLWTGPEFWKQVRGVATHNESKVVEQQSSGSGICYQDGDKSDCVTNSGPCVWDADDLGSLGISTTSRFDSGATISDGWCYFADWVPHEWALEACARRADLRVTIRFEPGPTATATGTECARVCTGGINYDHQYPLFETIPYQGGGGSELGRAIPTTVWFEVTNEGRPLARGVGAIARVSPHEC